MGQINIKQAIQSLQVLTKVARNVCISCAYSSQFKKPEYCNSNNCELKLALEDICKLTAQLEACQFDSLLLPEEPRNTKSL